MHTKTHVTFRNVTFTQVHRGKPLRGQWHNGVQRVSHAYCTPAHEPLCWIVSTDSPLDGYLDQIGLKVNLFILSSTTVSPFEKKRSTRDIFHPVPFLRVMFRESPLIIYQASTGIADINPKLKSDIFMSCIPNYVLDSHTTINGRSRLWLISSILKFPPATLAFSITNIRKETKYALFSIQLLYLHHART